MSSSPLRVLHFPLTTAGHPSTLVEAERRAGLRSRLVTLRGSTYDYSADVNLDLEDRPASVRLLKRLGYGLGAVARYDVFHFNSGQTILPLRIPLRLDMPLLRALGRRVFVTFQGCDARQSGFCQSRGGFGEAAGTQQGCPCDERLDGAKARRIRYISRWAHGVFCLNPDLLRLVPGAEFVPYASLDPKQVEPVFPTPDPGRTLTVLHAPTDRQKKGTELVLQACERLAAQMPLRLLLVEGKTRREAMELYREADLVVDQLRIGWYGGFAVEAMGLGKPVVAFIREEDFEFVPPRMVRELPIVASTPESLEHCLRDLLDNREELARRGRESRAYVQRWHDPDLIARRFLELYTGRADRFWPERDPDGV